MPKNRGLGRGLDAIYLDNTLPEDEKKTGTRQKILLSLIDVNPGQPRRTFDAESLGQLASSIEKNGLLQPILLRRSTLDRYEIIAGERRFRAAKLAGLSEIDAVILEADDRAAAKVALIENIQREDLNPVEEAAAYRTLMQQYGYTQEELAAEVGKSRSAVANALRLNDLPDEVSRMLVEKTLSAGHARALLGLKEREKMLPLAERCVSDGWSVREAEDAVRAENRKSARKPKPRQPADGVPKVDYIQSIAGRFTDRTGRQCRIRCTKNQKTIQFEFRDNADLEALCRLLAGEDFFEEF